MASVEKSVSIRARRRQAVELQALGAYTPGANPGLDLAMTIGDRIDDWARQAPYERTTYDETVRALAAAVGEEI